MSKVRVDRLEDLNGDNGVNVVDLFSFATLEARLANLNNPALNVALIGVAETGETLDLALKRIFPLTSPDHVTTSSAKISSATTSDDRSAELTALLAKYKYVTIDTQIALNDTVTISRDYTRIQCSPSGIILAGPGMAQKSILKVTGHHVTLSNLNMDNPLMLKSTTGGRQTAVNIQGDHCTVRDSIFRRMLHSICTEANGEWYMPTYFNNLAYDCIGVGAGATDDGSTNFGENRGDAFLIWGATGKMINNIAICMAGQDARIAFHCETLGTSYLTRPYDPKRDGHDYIMSGNIAIGTFRRHFVFEAVNRGLMCNNVSAGGATWWPVSITGGSDLYIKNLHLVYDRPVTNTAGAAWSPDRGGIMVGMGGNNIQMSDITIVFTPDAVGTGLGSLISNIVSKNVTLSNIRILKVPGQTGIGFVLDKLTDVKMSDCHVQNASIGLTTFGNQDCWIKDFSAYDITGDAVRFTGGGGGTIAHSRISGGRFERVGRAVNATNLTSLSIRGIQTKGVTGNHIEQFGTTGSITVDGCHDEDGIGKIVGLNPPFSLAQVRNIGNNLGYTYNFRYQIACITNAASALNTLGKHTDKIVVADDGFAYIATGSTAVAPWAKVATLTIPA